MGYENIWEYLDKGDFRINGQYTVEVGGKNKTPEQVRGIKDSFVAADDLEYGTGIKIALWMFGLLY